MSRICGWVLGSVGLLGVIGSAGFTSGEGPAPSLGEAEEVLLRQVKSDDLKVRQPAVFQLASRLKPGMTKKRVEDRLGPPDQDIKDHSTFDGVGFTLYFCRPPGADGSRLIALRYDVTGPTPRLLRVSEPFTLDCD
jgi:hypothetical protein